MCTNKKAQWTAMLIAILLSLLSLSAMAQQQVVADKIIAPTLIQFYDWKTHPVDDHENVLKLSPPWQLLEHYQQDNSPSLLAEARLYRAHFIIGWHYRTRDLAISIGPLQGTDEVYINGFRVDDSAGGDYDLFFQHGTRVYRLPRNKTWFSWLNDAKENELLIKLSAKKSGHLLNIEQVKIGDYETLALIARDTDSTIKVVQGAAISLLFIVILFIIFLHVNQYNNRANTLFGVFVFLISLSILFSSQFLNAPHYDGDLLLALSTSLDFIACIVFLSFMADKFNLVIGGGEAKLITIGGLSSGGLIVFIHYFSGQLGLNVIFMMLVMVLFFVIGYRVLYIMRLNGVVHRSILCALLIMFVGIVINAFCAGASWTLTPYHQGAILSAIFLLYVIAQDFKKMTLSIHSMSSRLVNIREMERARLTRDIHDGVGRGLATIGLFISMNLDKFEPQVASALKEEVDRTSTTLKSVIRHLKPIEIEDGDASAAIIKLAQHLCSIAKIELQIVQRDKAQVALETAYQLYRIGQEALNNSLKHGACSVIRIAIKKQRGLLIISLTDNGKGITKQPDNAGYGLSSMHDRALLIGALLRIDNTTEGGTQVCLEVPIND